MSCSNGDAAFGRGKTWVADGTADGAGRATVVFRSSKGDPVVVGAGQRVTMHAADNGQKTSEHSRSVVATAGGLESPYDRAVRCDFWPDF